MLPAPASPPDPARRLFLKALGTVGLTRLASAPAVHAQGPVTLRVLGTHATLQEAIRRQAEADLGIRLIFQPGGDSAVLQKAAAHPEHFDVYEQWSNSVTILWRAKAIQPIETRRIARWGEINDLTKTGRLTPEASIGQGDAPYKLLYIQPNGRLGSTPGAWVSFLPYVHNADSFGYDTRVIAPGEAYSTESWSWLLEERWQGRVALVNDPTIGLFDAALAAQAKGLMSFGDIGNLTRPEVDRLFRILIDYKQRGHFCGFWTSIPESIDFIASQRAAVASLFSPAATKLNSLGYPVIYAAPKEGYRAWHGVMCLSARTTGREQDAAYDYMNWWLSGWPGAFVARQGYYISVPSQARLYLSPAEWTYWYEGRPASEAIHDQHGQLIAQIGERRKGGSYWERMSRIVVWNTVMDTYEYTLPRWHELLLT